MPVFTDLLLDPLPRARRRFGGLDLGDKRRDDRAVKVAAAAAASPPGTSLPRQMGDAHQAKAAYRFLDTPDRVTFEPLACGLWAVRVWKPEPLPGAEPIEWVLLTSLPVAGLQDAPLMADWYVHRWLIEEYHKCVKTGCRVQGRQLANADRLAALLGILVVVAARPLAIEQRAGERPDAPATTATDELTVTVLAAKRKLKTPPGELTVHQFWREVVELGGFMGRRGDGDPGWQTTWLGWMKLRTPVE